MVLEAKNFIYFTNLFDLNCLGSCDSFDLKQDPGELYPLSCSDLAAKNAIIKFRNYQSIMLNWYNAKNG